MQKKIANFFYWILVKSAENYYGDSLKEVEVPYTPYFQIEYLFKLKLFWTFKKNRKEFNF